jgi:hypothetical protein
MGQFHNNSAAPMANKLAIRSITTTSSRSINLFLLHYRAARPKRDQLKGWLLKIEGMTLLSTDRLIAP